MDRFLAAKKFFALMMLVMIVLSVFTLGIVAEVEATDTTAVAAEAAADTTVDTSAETDTAAATDDSVKHKERPTL